MVHFQTLFNINFETKTYRAISFLCFNLLFIERVLNQGLLFCRVYELSLNTVEVLKKVGWLSISITFQSGAAEGQLADFEISTRKRSCTAEFGEISVKIRNI